MIHTEQTLPRKSRRLREYFDGRAARYTAADRFPWALLRRSDSRALFALVGDAEGQQVLELGCGAGFYTAQLLEAGALHVWAIDISEVMLSQIVDANVTTIAADAATVEIGRRFPLIVSAGLLEFVDDRRTVLANAALHLEAGGRMVLLYPVSGIPGRLYQLYHRLHGIEIATVSPGALSAEARETGLQVVMTCHCGLFSAVSVLREAK